MGFFRRAAAARLLLLALLQLPAAQALAEGDDQVWANVVAQGPISGDIVFLFDASVRFADNATTLRQSLVRGGIGKRLSRNLSVHAGYAHVRTTPPGGTSNVEHRGWQQAAYPILQGRRMRLTGRTRLEQRWLEDQGGMSLRIRQMVRFTVPLGDAAAPRFVAWHEGFLTLTDTGWSPDTGFDQQRSYVGITLPMGPHALEVGGFAQRFPQPDPDRVNRVLNITLVANF
jgi:hypothetical protein